MLYMSFVLVWIVLCFWYYAQHLSLYRKYIYVAYIVYVPGIIMSMYIAGHSDTIL